MSFHGAADAHPQRLCGCTTFREAMQAQHGGIPLQQTGSGANVSAGRRHLAERARWWRADASPTLCLSAGILPARAAAFVSGTLPSKRSW